ncbi:putative short-chain dehydrogenase [Truncatella angustata]|uniref:Short-chain dehydrogenase n=1 Tax=Truncatella angustata TaxID=152316 RepID=A0A9P8UVE0_9PEZI|nr:putative short-chain dehydrogenase [Truncatella angustata]KAH6659052.1 putative short-chain dehydrogenase [Truncatella angustata]
MASAKGTILVTGANGGLGSAIAKQIVSKPELAAFHGLYTVRDSTAAPALSSVLAANPSHPHDVISQDLTNLAIVRQTASTINARIAAGEIPPIRALVLCAGSHDFGKQAWDDDGLDKIFSSNYLGQWLLTLLLLGSMDKEHGRIVVIGSQAHDPYDKRNVSSKAFDDDKYKTIIQDEASVEAIARGNWSSAQEDPSFRGGIRRYGAAKLFLIIFQHELQRRLDHDPTLKNICILGVDPGTMITGLQRTAPWFIRVIIFQIIYPIIATLMPNGPVRSTQKSASHVLGAVFDSNPEWGEYPKDRYFNGAEPFETSTESRDVKKAQLVWKVSARLAHLVEGETSLVDWQ